MSAVEGGGSRGNFTPLFGWLNMGGRGIGQKEGWSKNNGKSQQEEQEQKRTRKGGLRKWLPMQLGGGGKKR